MIIHMNYIKTISNHSLKLLQKNYVFIFIFVAIIRLLFFEEFFIGFRDFDCLPHSDINITANDIVVRLLPYYINRIMVLDLDLSFFEAKKNFGCIMLIIFLLAFDKLLNEMNFSLKEKIFSMLLLIQNPILRGYCDSLGSYFLIATLFIVATVLSSTFNKNSFNRWKLLAFFTVIILLGTAHFFCSLFFVCFLIMFFVYGRNYVKTRWLALPFALMFLLSIYNVYLSQNHAKKLILILNGGAGSYFYAMDAVIENIKLLISQILNVIPNLLTGYTFENLILLFLVNLFVVYISIKLIKEFKIFSIYFAFFSFLFFLIVLMFVRSHGYIVFNLYPQNSTIYVMFFLPFLIITIVRFIFNKTGKYAVYFSICLFALTFFSNNLRKEGYDIKNYNKSLREIPDKVAVYIIPSFIVNTYELFLEIKITDKINVIDDYRQIKSNIYSIDLLKYKEMDYPIYNYNKEKKKIEKYLQSTQKAYYIKEHLTFTRFIVNY
ncbi:MAG: hypothetical protein HQK51_12865 [Oligoflexia bacterium]|nr:hypothetical protein [Oligoflexia bacterium]